MKTKRLLVWIALLVVLMGCGPSEFIRTTDSTSETRSDVVLVAETKVNFLYKYTDGWITCFFLEGKNSGIASPLWCK